MTQSSDPVWVLVSTKFYWVIFQVQLAFVWVLPSSVSFELVLVRPWPAQFFWIQLFPRSWLVVPVVVLRVQVVLQLAWVKCIMYSGSLGSQLRRHQQQRPLQGFAEDHMGSKSFKGIRFHCTSLLVDIQDDQRA